MKYRRSAVAAVSALMLGAAPSMSQEKPASIIVNTSGGENGPMLREAYFNDFEATTGVKIVDSSPADFGRLRAMVESGNVEYTVTEVESEDAWRAIELNLLEPIDGSSSICCAPSSVQSLQRRPSRPKRHIDQQGIKDVQIFI